jgi:hypothetical protein
LYQILNSLERGCFATRIFRGFYERSRSTGMIPDMRYKKPFIVSTHKNYNLEYTNIIFNGRYYKKVSVISGEANPLAMLLDMSISVGTYAGLANMINGLENHLNLQLYYQDFLDIIEVECTENNVKIQFFDDPRERAQNIPAKDLLSLLIELKEFVNQEPLHGTII